MGTRTIGRAGSGRRGRASRGSSWRGTPPSSAGDRPRTGSLALAPTSGRRIYTIGSSLAAPRPGDVQARDRRRGRAARTYTLADLRRLPRATQVSDFHCVTGWSVADVRWAGRVSRPARRGRPLPSARALRFVSAEVPTHSSAAVRRRLRARMDGQREPPARRAGPRGDAADVRLQEREWVSRVEVEPHLDTGFGAAGYDEDAGVLQRPAPDPRSARRSAAPLGARRDAATGLVLYLPVPRAVARRNLVSIHLLAAVAWVLALAISSRRRSAERTGARSVDRRGRQALAARRAGAAGPVQRGAEGNTILTVSFALLFVVSGSMLWLGERDHRFILDDRQVHELPRLRRPARRAPLPP